MQSEELLQLTASEPLSMAEEQDMQRESYRLAAKRNQGWIKLTRSR